MAQAKTELLTDLAVKKIKAAAKPKYHPDGKGLYLAVSPAGHKTWVLRTWSDGKESRHGLGSYAEVSLAEARARAEEWRTDLRKTGSTPTQKVKAEKAAERAAKEAEQQKIKHTFEAIARAWHKKLPITMNAKHRAQCLSTLEAWAFPKIGALDITAISHAQILDEVLEPMLNRVDAAGKKLNPPDPLIETSTRVCQRMGAVFEYAIFRDLCTANPVTRARKPFGVLVEQWSKVKRPSNFAAVTDRAELGKVLKTIEGYASRQTALALRTIAYTAVRSGELRRATWAEFKLTGKQPTWIVPADHMKAGVEHIVPLSTQAVKCLQELREIAGASDLVVPTPLDPSKPISDMALSMALRRMGLSGKQTVHGFRGCFSSIANESMRYRHKAIEAQLAHTIRDDVEAAYNRAQYLEERREMMQEYADLLDSLRDGGGKVIPIRKAARNG